MLLGFFLDISQRRKGFNDKTQFINQGWICCSHSVTIFFPKSKMVPSSLKFYHVLWNNRKKLSMIHLVWVFSTGLPVWTSLIVTPSFVTTSSCIPCATVLMIPPKQCPKDSATYSFIITHISSLQFYLISYHILLNFLFQLFIHKISSEFPTLSLWEPPSLNLLSVSFIFTYSLIKG